MKNIRQERILEIIVKTPVQTQEELMNKLRAEGFSVTQATVSRDIKELNLVKVASSDGKYRYSSDIPRASKEAGSRFVTMCTQNAVAADYAGNICVIRCMSGTANAVCACIDAAAHSDIVGTIAGDDTIFILMRNEDNAKDFCLQIRAFIA